MTPRVNALKSTKTPNVFKAWACIGIGSIVTFLATRFYVLEQRVENIEIRDKLVDEFKLQDYTYRGPK